MAIAHARLASVQSQLSAQLTSELPHPPRAADGEGGGAAGGSRARTADGASTCADEVRVADVCSSLRAAREARARDVDQALRACEKRLEALRATRLDASTNPPPVGEMELCATEGADARATHELSGTPLSADVAAADRALRDLDSSAAFELEQAYWRGGLRGGALQARVQHDLDELRAQWLEHKALAEANARDVARRRASQRANLAAQVHRSQLNAAAHTLARLVEGGHVAGGELAAIALQALCERALAANRAAACAVGAQRREMGLRGLSSCSAAASQSANAPAALRSSVGPAGKEGAAASAPPSDDAPLALVLEIGAAAEALATQLHAELSFLAASMRAARERVLDWVSADAELAAVAAAAAEDARLGTDASERALRVRCDAFDADVHAMREAASAAFSAGVARAMELAEAWAMDGLVHTTRAVDVPVPVLGPSQQPVASLPRYPLPPTTAMAPATHPPPRPSAVASPPHAPSACSTAPPPMASLPPTAPLLSSAPSAQAALPAATFRPRPPACRAAARPCTSACMASFPACAPPPPLAVSLEAASPSLTPAGRERAASGTEGVPDGHSHQHAPPPLPPAKPEPPAMVAPPGDDNRGASTPALLEPEVPLTPHDGAVDGQLVGGAGGGRLRVPGSAADTLPTRGSSLNGGATSPDRLGTEAIASLASEAGGSSAAVLMSVTEADSLGDDASVVRRLLWDEQGELASQAHAAKEEAVDDLVAFLDAAVENVSLS